MWRDRLTEFADCLQLGLLVCVASVPVVTVGPAFAAGCRVVSRWRDGDSPPMVRTFRAEYVKQLRGGVPFSIGVIALMLVLSVELALVGSGLPGSEFYAIALPVLIGVLAVVTLRTCSMVSLHNGWTAALRAAARLDVRGAALLGGAVFTAGFLVWTQPLMLLIVAGPLTLAAVGTTR
jgi:Protein of unknown function, DUF624